MRNEMHSFQSVPAANIPRSRFSMPCNVKFTGNTGKLIPFYVAEVLPGDTFQVRTSIVCRLQTLIHPIMDNMYLDTYYFYVPNRLVWDNWKHFCGEPDKAWVPSKDWTIPKILIRGTFENATQYNKYFKDSIFDYMGVGFDPNYHVAGDNVVVLKYNALPIRAYNKIYDDWFRDENLEDPVNLYTGDNDVHAQFGYDSDDVVLSPLSGGVPYTAAKLHDYFTSALPQAQRGNPVELSFGDNIKANVNPQDGVFNANGVTFGLSNGTDPTAGLGTARIGDTPVYTNVGIDLAHLSTSNLMADMSNLSLGISINDLRMAFQVQKFMERSARGGARYIELLKSMFGVTSPDARLQRSEYLGGHRVPINIHQIVNTTETIDAPLGNTGAMSVTSDVHEDFIHSFVEHGFVIGICCVRYKHTYPQGNDRFWNRNTKFDFYWPVFASIGEQPIKNAEIFISGDVDNIDDLDKVFGYQEAWADYRYKPNRVMGEMRPGIANTLASWHLADFYTQQPVLSDSWIKEDKMPVDRAIAVTSEVADQFLFDFLIDNNATRPMPLYSIPGLVDHF